MTLLLTIATIASPEIARSPLPLPCGPKLPIILTRRTSGGHTSSAFPGARTVTPVPFHLSKNTFLPFYLQDPFSPHDFFIQRCIASPDSYINLSSTSVPSFACAAHLFLFAKKLPLRPTLLDLPHARTLLFQCRCCHRARDSLATVLQNPRWPLKILNGRDLKSPTKMSTC